MVNNRARATRCPFVANAIDILRSTFPLLQIGQFRSLSAKKKKKKERDTHILAPPSQNALTVPGSRFLLPIRIRMQSDQVREIALALRTAHANRDPNRLTLQDLACP